MNCPAQSQLRTAEYCSQMQNHSISLKKLEDFGLHIYSALNLMCRNARLNTWKTFSALPLVDGWYGADRMLCMPLNLQSFPKLCGVNGVPLSKTICSKFQNRENSSFIFRTVLKLFADFTCSTPPYLLKASIYTSHFNPKNGLAYSIWSRVQGLKGKSQTESWDIGGSFECWKHWTLCAQLRSMSLSIPGHQTLERASRFMRTTPMCLS